MTTTRKKNDPIELEAFELQQKAAIQENRDTEIGVAAVNSVNNITIFSLFLTEGLRAVLTEFGRILFFPAAALMSIILAGLAVREAYLERGKNKGTIVRAGVEIVTALAVTTAVVGGFVASTIFTAASPIIFAAMLGFRTAYHTIAAITAGVKSVLTDDPKEKAAYRKEAVQHTISAVTSALSMIGIIGAMMLGKFVWAAFAIGSNAVGFGILLYKAITKPKTPSITATQTISNDQKQEEKNDLGSTAKNKLRLSSDNKQSVAASQDKTEKKVVSFTPNAKTNFGVIGNTQQNSNTTANPPANERTALLRKS